MAGIKYIVSERVFGFDQTKTAKFIPTAVSADSIDFEKVCRKVSDETGIHRGMVKLSLLGMLDVITAYMEEGHGIKLGEFGSIRPALKVKSELSAEEVTAGNVVRTKIVFTPGAQLKQMLANMKVTKFTGTTGEGGTVTDPDPDPDNGGGDNGGGTGGGELPPLG